MTQWLLQEHKWTLGQIYQFVIVGLLGVIGLTIQTYKQSDREWESRFTHSQLPEIQLGKKK